MFFFLYSLHQGWATDGQQATSGPQVTSVWPTNFFFFLTLKKHSSFFQNLRAALRVLLKVKSNFKYIFEENASQTWMAQKYSEGLPYSIVIL